MKDKITNTTSEEQHIRKTFEEMKAEQGTRFSLPTVNLTELGRRTGISRAKLRQLKEDNFEFRSRGNKGRKAEKTVLTGYTAVLDALLCSGITNSSVCLERLQSVGFPGGIAVVKDYIAAHMHLVPAKRQMVVPQGNRGRRYTTEPGEAFQMDWGFVKVQTSIGQGYIAACFAMICHHCGQWYIEFFPIPSRKTCLLEWSTAFNTWESRSTF